jgi:signal transduction histidine kinase
MPYSSPDTLAGSIAVEVVYTDSEVHLIVRDTGVGIPAMGQCATFQSSFSQSFQRYPENLGKIS